MPVTILRRCLLAVCLVSPFGPATAAQIEFLYLNAGEDSAAGGHVALKMDDEVFHFQHVPPGLLKLKRDDYAQFRELYADRENRTIQLHHVEVSAETFALLRERFNRTFLIEEEQFSRLDMLENDRRLLDALLQPSHQGEGETRMALKGVGLFLPDAWRYTESAPEPAPPVQPSLARLAGRVEAAYGGHFLPVKNDAILLALKGLQPGYAATADALAEDRFRSAGYAFSERYADHLTGLAALWVLKFGLPLREGALLRPAGAEFRLREAETLGLREYRGLLENQLLGLLRGNRPDWGFPMLVGMARLIVLDESIATGRLVLLNRAEPRSTVAEPWAVPDPNRHAAQASGRARFLAAKATLAGPIDEWAYSHVEKTANAYVELDRALREGRPARLEGMDAVPANPASVALVPSAMTAAQVQSELEQLETERASHQAYLADLYAYRLIGRNCATEIFRVIGQAMREAARESPRLDGQEPTQDSAEAESMRRLGGHVSGFGPEFIPFLSFRVVGENWRVSSSETVPSYRLRRLGQYQVLENPWWVGLRESNVFSSSLYAWHGGDSAFVFFTDDGVWARPLAGGVNLAASLAQAVSGLLTLPWDGGENLRLGIKGALISLPELFFANIRKGSFPGNIGLGE